MTGKVRKRAILVLLLMLAGGKAPPSSLPAYNVETCSNSWV
jgi:hypothetical protein